MPSRLLKASAIYALANALSAGVPFLLIPILTRTLSPDDYGMIVSFFLLASLSTSMAGLSVQAAVSVRWFSREGMDFPRFVGSAILLATASTAVCALILRAVAALLPGALDLPAELWPLAAVFTGANILIAVRATLWQSQQRAVPSAVLQVVAAISNGALSLVGVLAFSAGGAGRVLGATASSVGCALLAVVLLRSAKDLRFGASKGDMGQLLRFGVPLVPHALGGALAGSVDRFAVGGGLGQEALGIYGLAAQLGMVMSVLGDALVKAFSPWMYAHLSSGRAMSRLVVVGATYLLIPVWFLLALSAWMAFEIAGPLIVGARYTEAIHLSLWFLIGGAVTASYLNIGNLFFFTGKTEWLSVATVTTAVLAIAASALLVPQFGLRGAAAAFVFVQLAQLTFSWLLSTRVRPMPWLHPRLAWRALRRSMRPDRRVAAA